MNKNKGTSSKTTTINIEPNDYSQRGRCEVDTQTSSMSAGMMLELIKTTGQLCNSIGFHPDLPSIKGILNGTIATA